MMIRGRTGEQCTIRGTVSVVVPTYNGRAFLREALQSVFDQSRPAHEIIVVDDASTDDTVELVTSLKSHSSIPLRLKRLRNNSGGPARPINVAVAAATGEYVAVLEQDDVLLPTKLHDQVLAMEHPDTAMAFSLSGSCDAQGGVIAAKTFAPELWEQAESTNAFNKVAGRQALRFFIANLCFTDYWWGYPGFLFRRSDWQRLGGCDERLRIASDSDFMCKLCSRGTVAYFPNVHYYRRQHDGNLCNDQIAMYREAIRVQARHLGRNPWLLRDKAVSRELRAQFAQVAALATRARRYCAAMECHLLKWRLWGLDRDDFRFLAVLTRGLRSKRQVRPPRSTDSARG